METFDPWADDPTEDKKVTNTSNDGPVMQKNDNWVSFTFNSAVPYDKIGATVHGDPEFVAKVFNVENFDGKISTLMKKAVKVDEYFKKQYSGGEQGKA